jgi:hypothetical protein
MRAAFPPRSLSVPQLGRPAERVGGAGATDKRGASVIEIMLISLVVMAIVVVLAGLVGRLGDLDDVSTMRDMVDST